MHRLTVNGKNDDDPLQLPQLSAVLDGQSLSLGGFTLEAAAGNEPVKVELVKDNPQITREIIHNKCSLSRLARLKVEILPPELVNATPEQEDVARGFDVVLELNGERFRASGLKVEAAGCGVVDVSLTFAVSELEIDLLTRDVDVVEREEVDIKDYRQA